MINVGYFKDVRLLRSSILKYYETMPCLYIIYDIKGVSKLYVWEWGMGDWPFFGAGGRD